MNPRPQNTYTAPRAPAPPFPGAPPGFATPSHYYNPLQSFDPALYQSTQYNPYQFQAPAVQTSSVQVQPTPEGPMEDPVFRDWIRKALVYFNVPFTDPELPTPFTARLMRENLPTIVKLPELGEYSGDGDPRVHAGNYKILMDMVGASDAYICSRPEHGPAGPQSPSMPALFGTGLEK